MATIKDTNIEILKQKIQFYYFKQDGVINSIAFTWTYFFGLMNRFDTNNYSYNFFAGVHGIQNMEWFPSRAAYLFHASIAIGKKMLNAAVCKNTLAYSRGIGIVRGRVFVHTGDVF